MKKIGIADVRTRLRNIPEGEANYTKTASFREQADKAIKTGFPSRIIFNIECGIGDNTASMSEDTMMDLFDALAEVGTESQIRKYGNLIMNEYVSKTRDASETLKYMKQKLGRAKSKVTTKIQNNFDDLWQATNSTIGSAKDNFKKNTEPYKNAIANAKTRAKQAGKKLAPKKEEAVIAAYEAMVEQATKIVSVDRILENYNKLSKRFNIDRIIQENTVCNDVADTCVEVCNLVDTYDMPVKARYNTALETVWYGLHKNGFTFNESEVVTTISDFYMASGGNSFACKSILETSMIFDKGDYIGDIDVITEEDPEEDEPIQESLMESKTIEFNLDSWDVNKNNILYITGVSASGKSTLGHELANKYNAQYISLDHYTSLASKGPSRLKDAMNDGTMEDIDILAAFFKKYPKEFIGKDISENEKKKHFLFFFNWLNDYLGGNGHLYIVEGIHLFMYTNSEFYKNKPIICMTTSTIVSFCRRLIRGYERKLDKGDSTVKAIAYVFADAIKNGIPMYADHSKKANTFIIGISKNGVQFKEAYEYMVEGKLSAKDRKKIADKDYGIPSKRKYPMPDESHVRSAIQMFNHVDSADEAELARNIKKKIKQYGMSVEVGPKNRFSKYYNEAFNLPLFWEIIREDEEKMKNISSRHFNKLYGTAKARDIAKKRKDDEHYYTFVSPRANQSSSRLSFQSGSISNSMAKTNPELFNTAKMVQMLSCENLVDTYNLFVSENLSKLQAEYAKNMEEAQRVARIEGDGNFFKTPRAIMEAQKDVNVILDSFFKDYTYLLKEVNNGNLTEKEVEDALVKTFFPEYTSEKECRAIINARINRNRLLANTLRGMIQINYNALGLSEDEAKSLMKELSSDETNAEALGKIKDLLKNPELLEKFRISDNNYDFRKIGGGFLFLSGDEDIKFSEAPSKNLEVIMQYDAVVTAHGSEEEATNHAGDAIESYKKLKNSYNDDIAVVKRIAKIAKSEDDYVETQIDKFMRKQPAYQDLSSEEKESISKEVKNQLSTIYDKMDDELDKAEDRNSKFKVYSKYRPEIDRLQKLAVRSLFKADIDRVTAKAKEDYKEIANAKSLIDKMPNNFDDAKKMSASDFEGVKSPYQLAKSLGVGYGDASFNSFDCIRYLRDYLTSKSKIKEGEKSTKSRWTIQPVDTLTKRNITDVNELLYTLRDEGFKNVILTACNPGSINLPDDLKKDPNFKVTHGTFSVYKESYEPTDDIDKQFTIIESRLDRMAYECGIVLNEATTLSDLYNEYTELCNTNSTIYLHEGVGDFLKSLAHKAIEIVITIWKTIVKVAKNVWKAIKEFFVGKPTEKKTENKLDKPIEISVIEANNNHATLVKKKVNSLDEAKNIIAGATRKISQAIDRISNEETTNMKRLETKASSVKPISNKENSTAKDESFLKFYYGSSIIHEINNPKEIDFNKILNDYKVSNDANKPNRLMALVRKLYSLSPSSVIEGTPSLLSYLRNILVIGGFAINPVVGVISFIADQVATAHYKREEVAEMREAFKAEIRKTDKKIDSTKSQSQKDNLTAYRKALTDAYNKIDEYYEGLLTDKELDDKYDAADDDDIKAGGGSFGDAELDAFEDMFGDDFDDDFGDFDDMEGFEESGKFVVLMGNLYNIFSEDCEEKSFDQHKCRKMIRMNPSIVGDLAKITDKYPQIISKHDLTNAIDDVRSDIQIGAVRINMIERYDLNNTYDELMRSPNTIIEQSDIFTEAKRFAAQIEITKALNEIYSACVYYSPLTEASFTNSLKLAGEKLKKGIQKASDADKTISKNIDSAMSSFTRSAERAMTNDRRDAIIRGSVIPSASKIIKGAIMAGATTLVLGPAVAVIGVLGYLGMSKKLNDKQRKALIDEIEIELKMCQKYIDLAESKNDLKALKKLYTIQRELEKQRAKIKFKIGLKGERYHSPESMPTDGIET